MQTQATTGNQAAFSTEADAPLKTGQGHDKKDAAGRKTHDFTQILLGLHIPAAKSEKKPPVKNAISQPELLGLAVTTALSEPNFPAKKPAIGTARNAQNTAHPAIKPTGTTDQSLMFPATDITDIPGNQVKKDSKSAPAISINVVQHDAPSNSATEKQVAIKIATTSTAPQFTSDKRSPDTALHKKPRDSANSQLVNIPKSGAAVSKTPKNLIVYPSVNTEKTVQKRSLQVASAPAWNKAVRQPNQKSLAPTKPPTKPSTGNKIAALAPNFSQASSTVQHEPKKRVSFAGQNTPVSPPVSPPVSTIKTKAVAQKGSPVNRPSPTLKSKNANATPATPGRTPARQSPLDTGPAILTNQIQNNLSEHPKTDRGTAPKVPAKLTTPQNAGQSLAQPATIVRVPEHGAKRALGSATRDNVTPSNAAQKIVTPNKLTPNKLKAPTTSKGQAAPISADAGPTKPETVLTTAFVSKTVPSSRGDKNHKKPDTTPTPSDIPTMKQKITKTDASSQPSLLVPPASVPGDTGAAISTTGTTPFQGAQLHPDAPVGMARSVAQQLVIAAAQLPERPLELSLNPKELGHVRMTLSVADTGITVAIAIDRSDTMNLMRRHIDTLVQEFKGMGYGTVDFQFSQNSQQNNSQPGFGSANRADTAGPGAPSDMVLASPDVAPTRVSLQPSDRLDLRL